MDGGDNRLRRGERWINPCARCNCAVRFRGMIEQFFWKLHCPRNASGASIKLTVNEIGAAAEEQTNRRCDDEIVAQIQPRNLMSMRVVKREEQQPKPAAMTRHSTFPNSQDQ